MKLTIIIICGFLLSCTKGEIEDVDSNKNLISFGPVQFEVSFSADNKLFQGVSTSKFIKQLDPEIFLSILDSVSRQGDSLSIMLENGQEKIFINEHRDPVVSQKSFPISYRFSADFPGFYEITATNQNDNWMMLVNKKSGDITRLESMAIFSPSHKFILTANPDVWGNGEVKPVELFEIIGNEIVLLGRHNPTSWLPYSVKWITDDRVLITIGEITRNGELETIAYLNIELNRV